MTGEVKVPNGTLLPVWVVRCDDCGWLPEWNRDRSEALTILQEHLDEVHD